MKPKDTIPNIAGLEEEISSSGQRNSHTGTIEFVGEPVAETRVRRYSGDVGQKVLSTNHSIEPAAKMF
jgi:hypothetical protein